MYNQAMHFTLHQLKVFESVARLLSYTRAAEELFLSQPAVSMQIKQLEDNIGLPLFDRLGKKIYLTEAGHEMFHYSRTIAQQISEAETVIEEMKGIKRGRLVISVASTANYFSTRLLAIFNKRIEGVTVSLDVTNRENLLQQLNANDTDLVIMGKPPEELDLEAEPFMDNPLVVIAAPDHPYAKRKRIPLTDLQNETFVVRESVSGTRIATERFFNEKGIQLNTGMVMTSNEAIQQAVQAGLGLGIVSLHTLELELKTNHLVVLDVESFPIMRQWYIVHRKGKRFAAIPEAFKNFVLENAQSLIKLPG